jgi:hypothetical protein
MNKLFFLLFTCMTVYTLHAQPPKKFNYQGIARQSDGTPMVSQSLGIRLSIMDSSTTGPIRYVETHTTQTNAHGIFNIAVGGGTAVTNTMDSVMWAAADKYLKVEMDPAGGTSYTTLGTSQLLSVPFAMYAENPGPQGPTGPTGPTGATGATGAAGPAGVLTVAAFNGNVGSIAASATGYVFAGPTATVTTTSAYTRVTGAASAPIALPTGTAVTVRTGLCYQLGTGTITNFVGSAYSIITVSVDRHTVSAAGTVVLSPGTYTVGFCVYNTSTAIISNNDYVNGWVMVTP